MRQDRCDAGRPSPAGRQGPARIVASAGHDILVAGEVACYFTDDELRAILLDWAADKEPDDGTEDDARVTLAGTRE